ncbi:hypothetical protein O181_061158 [Austropuccinia psidii MF-1]|uniref:B30.2/SPRY domain-containing protein n=1 Tax=Austropuccinia psidii MF-1 TaxID=1389203 RepID=A0A9Q3EM89_9BASI|nr:hypothetical protein [Austropuccinia psidii MF-1]
MYSNPGHLSTQSIDSFITNNLSKSKTNRIIKSIQASSSSDHDSTLALLLPILILFSTLLFLLLTFLIFLFILRRKRSLSSLSSQHHLLRLNDHDGPIDLSLPDDDQIQGGIKGLESRWLDTCTELIRSGYLRAKLYQIHYPPNSLPTDITLSQFLSIQEKGVSAWAFEPDYDYNPSLPILVQSRTEITFLDGVDMSEEEGGGVSIQSNLPLPKLNEVYYFECKIYEKPEGSEIGIGLATKPYPSFRLPGWNRLSIGYFSADGFKSHNYPFTATSYGPSLKQGDVLGVGYRPRTGSVFFTRNGKKLEDAYTGLNRFNLFPTIGATGPASVHVNLGQAGFVFIEANVKKWGLAPMAGTLAPPPAYGHQMGSILLASAQQSHPSSPTSNVHHHRHLDRHSSIGGQSSPETIRPSNYHSRQPANYSNRTDSSDNMPHNPPTPRPLDISLEQLSNQSNHHLSSRSSQQSDGFECQETRLELGEQSSRLSSQDQADIRPPQYAAIDPYKYAAGVAEVMLSEQFQGTSHSYNPSRSRD